MFHSEDFNSALADVWRDSYWLRRVSRSMVGVVAEAMVVKARVKGEGEGWKGKGEVK